MTFIDRIKTAWAILQNLGVLDDVLVKIEALNQILVRLSTVEKALSTNETLLSLANRVEALDAAVRKVEELGQPAPKVEPTGKAVHPVKEDLMEWNRLKILSQFVALAPKAKEIEAEWQKIQQDEHDFRFAFETAPNPETEAHYVFKKGIAEGIKWCVNRFS